ncbi:MAG: hypothetical protein KKH94_06050, partial [Candidatus Omnitrophica bacterium]|nr:hypothetical protein [Candidatus Omnitrophota bacterium]
MFKKLVKIMAIPVVMVFTTNTIALSAPDFVYRVNVPQEYGRVKERWKGTGPRGYNKNIASNNNRTVIIVQDAHNNFGAQKNIAHLIQSIIPQFDTTHTVIGVEGAIGKIDISRLRNYPISEAREQASEAIMRKGYLTGVEHAAVCSEESMNLWGIEDADLFYEDFRLFHAVSSRKELVETMLNQLIVPLITLKEMMYDDELKRFDVLESDYEQERRKISDYVSSLYTYAEKYAIDLYQYPHLTLFKEIAFLSSSIDQHSLEQEIDRLCETVPYFGEYAESNTDTAMLELWSIAQREGVFNEEAYPLIQKKMQIIRKHALFDVHHLKQDIESLTHTIKIALAQTEDEKKLIELDKKIYLLEKVLTLQGTRDEVTAIFETIDYDLFIRLTNELATIAKGNNLVHLTRGSGGLDLDRLVGEHDSTDEVSKLFNQVQKFYTLAKGRESAMVDNLLIKMEEDRKIYGILVAGGYHSDGIAKILKERNISYVTVTPNINTVTDATGYMDRMMGNLIPLAPHLTSYITARNINGCMKALCGVAGEEAVMQAFGDAWQWSTVNHTEWASRLKVIKDTVTDLEIKRKIDAIYTVANSIVQRAVIESTSHDMADTLTQIDLIATKEGMIDQLKAIMDLTRPQRIDGIIVESKLPSNEHQEEVIKNFLIIFYKYLFAAELYELDAEKGKVIKPDGSFTLEKLYHYCIAQKKIAGLEDIPFSEVEKIIIDPANVGIVYNALGVFGQNKILQQQKVDQNGFRAMLKENDTFTYQPLACLSAIIGRPLLKDEHTHERDQFDTAVGMLKDIFNNIVIIPDYETLHTTVIPMIIERVTEEKTLKQSAENFLAQIVTNPNLWKDINGIVKKQHPFRLHIEGFTLQQNGFITLNAYPEGSVFSQMREELTHAGTLPGYKGLPQIFHLTIAQITRPITEEQIELFNKELGAFDIGTVTIEEVTLQVNTQRDGKHIAGNIVRLALGEDNAERLSQFFLTQDNAEEILVGALEKTYSTLLRTSLVSSRLGRKLDMPSGIANIEVKEHIDLTMILAVLKKLKENHPHLVKILQERFPHIRYSWANNMPSAGGIFTAESILVPEGQEMNFVADIELKKILEDHYSSSKVRQQNAAINFLYLLLVHEGTELAVREGEETITPQLKSELQALIAKARAYYALTETERSALCALLTELDQNEPDISDRFMPVIETIKQFNQYTILSVRSFDALLDLIFQDPGYYEKYERGSAEVKEIKTRIERDMQKKFLDWLDKIQHSRAEVKLPGEVIGLSEPIKTDIPSATWSVAFSPNGNEVLQGGRDMFVRLYRIERDENGKAIRLSEPI